MALSTIPNAATVWAASSPMTTLNGEIGVNSRNDCAPERLTKEKISLRTTIFTKAIGKKFFQEANAPQVRSLNELLQFVSENGVGPIRDKMNKQEGFLTRLFSSKERWEDWLKDKTPLGEVVSLYCERMTHLTPLEALMDRLDKRVLEVANRDAAHLLQSLKQPSEDHVFTARNLPPNFSLSLLNGTNGFAVNGENAFGDAGSSVSGAGDVNGDGIADFVVGAPANSNGLTPGQAYVIYGSSAPWSSTLRLSSLNGANGFALIGQNASDFTGLSVSGVGDVNNDGIADFAIGAPGADSQAGNTYVVYGSSALRSSPMSLSSLNGVSGFVLTGENAGDQSGSSVSGAGDVNGDGIADFVVGAPDAGGAGKTYLIYGSSAPRSSRMSLSSLNGVNGFVLTGENARDGSGSSVSGVGDINGDGIADFAIGAPAAGGTGKTYGVFGSKATRTSPMSLSSLNGVNGFVLTGENAGDLSGVSVSGAGDINDDGIADFVVGAYAANSNAGKTYAIYGSSTWSSPMSLSSLNGGNGFILTGENAGDLSGFSVSGAGDVNGDGIADFAVGAIRAGSGAGKTYAIFGSKAPRISPMSLSSLNGTNGIVLDGETVSDSSGSSVSAAGDINHDGIADIVVGAPGANSSTGNAYVIFGEVAQIIKPADARHLVPDWKTTAFAVAIVAGVFR